MTISLLEISSSPSFLEMIISILSSFTSEFSAPLG